MRGWCKFGQMASSPMNRGRLCLLAMTAPNKAIASTSSAKSILLKMQEFR
jgi:hypothetical protein